MKFIFKCFVLPMVLLFSSNLYAQVGIGTTVPDSSSVLDIYSKSKGFLMPRLSTVQRDSIILPATGLLIYNQTLKDCQLNIGTPAVPIWIGFKAPVGPMSITENDDVSTTSTANVLVTGMTISPPPGSYIVLFNSQMASDQSFSTNQGIIDVNGIYNDLMNVPGGVAHALVFGNKEVLLPGVYDVTGALSIADTTTMDGGGDTNAVFIIRATGAFTTGAGTVVLLTNGARSNNIFWVSEVAMSTGAPTTLQGSIVSHNGAVSLGANTNLEGRMFSTNGALTMGANSILSAPSGASSVDLGVLSTFAMFTASGAISGCVTCAVTGDVGTGLGAATSFGGIIGTVYPAGSVANDPNITTYSVYQNGVEVVNSGRTIDVLHSIVSLQALVTVGTGENIEIRWKVYAGEAKLNNRILSLIPAGY